MKKLLVLSLSFVFAYNNIGAQESTNYPNGFAPQTSDGLSFKENKGQVSDQNGNPRADVLFSGTNGTMVFHLRKTGISYQQTRVDSWKKPEPKTDLPLIKTEEAARPDQVTVYRLDINWLNVSNNPVVSKGEN